jgi:hypothetical protein
VRHNRWILDWLGALGQFSRLAAVLVDAGDLAVKTEPLRRVLNLQGLATGG